MLPSGASFRRNYASMHETQRGMATDSVFFGRFICSVSWHCHSKRFEGPLVQRAKDADENAFDNPPVALLLLLQVIRRAKRTPAMRGGRGRGGATPGRR